MTRAVLVVDDEPIILTALAAALEDDDYAVLTARDGDAALALHAASPADLIISDMMMPRRDGLALVRALRARGDCTPVILLSALPIPNHADGATWRLRKPFDLADVLDLVSVILGDA